ncbi:MAG: hypothetical protein K0S32_1516 [Bacteroidetes bacterium]|nr:hypothetical protein [Bacteroidota bacterium]
MLIALPWMLGAQKEVETTARINFVTVYTSAAEISCEKEITLPKGKTTVVFTDLTPYIVENSVNVSISNPKVNIVTVSEHINYTKEKRNVNERVINYKDSIVSWKKQLGLINCKSEVAEAEKNLLFKGESIGGLSTQGVSVAEIEKASNFFNKRYYELATQLYYLREKEDILNEKINNHENQVKQAVTVTVKTMSEIKVTVNCPNEERVKFKFKFLTPKAGWAPLYDFKYEGPSKPLQFVFRANVFNASGISWQDVNMKLTTADPVNGFSLPSLSASASKNPVGDVKFKEIQVMNAVTEYTIAHEYSIPSDAKPYAIDVYTSEMKADFNYLCIPKMDPFGFLMAKIPAWNAYNLIPGTTNIYNMGTYMGRTFLNTYSDNDTLDLYLGKDKNIQCARNEKTVDHKHFFIGNFSVEETKTEILVKNNSGETLPVEVIDQVPVFDKDDKEKMEVDFGRAFYDKNEGQLKWVFNVKAGENITLNYEYKIRTAKEHYESGYRASKKKFRTISCPAF